MRGIYVDMHGKLLDVVMTSFFDVHIKPETVAELNAWDADWKASHNEATEALYEHIHAIAEFAWIEGAETMEF